ncbi:BgTH12-01669 [Blumeria graminis f. sp. triticale]|uniref:BgTH12-01669 n=1 Tax=Blumeria graminis f. sp. triticale TaxID=1689686 RepID=A0A9W4CZW6_BLUGR|nr:BgTH12-01669 [Blumeria graminis f. sp. triticale]
MLRWQLSLEEIQFSRIFVRFFKKLLDLWPDNTESSQFISKKYTQAVSL